MSSIHSKITKKNDDVLKCCFLTWIDCKLGKIVAADGFVGFSFHCFLSHPEAQQMMSHCHPDRLLIH